MAKTSPEYCSGHSFIDNIVSESGLFTRYTSALNALAKLVLQNPLKI